MLLFINILFSLHERHAMPKLFIKNGSKFGKLTVVKELPAKRLPSGQTNRTFLCKCDCGNTTEVRLLHLVRGRIKSCGCLVGLTGTHGDFGKPLHTIWRGMKNRGSKYHSESHLYYDRGVRVCEEWQNSYPAFRDWALLNGYKDGLQIDRRNNDKGYTPDNCRFVTPLVQANNRRCTIRVKYKGEERSFSMVLHEQGKHEHYATILSRIRRGWDAQEAIDKPIRQGNYRR